jgi:hypothetical protein
MKPGSGTGETIPASYTYSKPRRPLGEGERVGGSARDLLPVEAGRRDLISLESHITGMGAQLGQARKMQQTS